MVAVFSPKMSVTIYQSSWRHNPQDRSLNHTRHEKTRIYGFVTSVVNWPVRAVQAFYRYGTRRSTDDNLSTGLQFLSFTFLSA